MAEIDGDFGRLKLPLPPHFSGEPHDWEEWEWNFRTYIAMFQPTVLDFLDRASTSDAEVVDAHFAIQGASDDDVQKLITFSRKLHYLLGNLCTGSARLLVRQNVRGNGFETWRLLYQRFSLPDASRHVSLLTKILDWKFNTSTFEQDFNAWETTKAKYEQQTGQQLPDSILVATMMNKTTGALQQHLRLNAGNITTFAQVKQLLVQYFRSRHIINTQDTSGPMDIGAIKGKGKYKGKGKGGKSNFSHWNFMKGKGSYKGKGKGKHFKGDKGKGKGKQMPQTSSKGKGKGKGGAGLVCWTCGAHGHTSRECRAGRINAVDDTSVNETSWNDEWNEWTWNDPTYFGEFDGSWQDDHFVGHVGFDDWWTDDWTSWDDWSWDQTWTSWNEAGQASTSGTPTLQEAQSRTSVQVTELPASGSAASQGTSAQVSAVLAEPPGLQVSQGSRVTPSTSRGFVPSMMLAAITLNTFGVGTSVSLGHVTTSGSVQQHQTESTHFETLESVGLSHLSLPVFQDFMMNQHMVIASSADTSWVLFDSGAAAHCCPKNFAPEWPLLPLNA